MYDDKPDDLAATDVPMMIGPPNHPHSVRKTFPSTSAVVGLFFGIASIFFFWTGVIPLLAFFFGWQGLYTSPRDCRMVAWFGLLLGIGFLCGFAYFLWNR